MNEQVKEKVLEAINSGTFFVQAAGSIDDLDIQEVYLEEKSGEDVIKSVAEALVLFNYGLFQYLMDHGYGSQYLEDADWKAILEDFLDADMS